MNISYLRSYNERNPDVLHHLRLQMVRTAQQTSNKAAADQPPYGITGGR